jgi:Protein of unknown function (DUF3540)
MQLMLEQATFLGPARVARVAGPKLQLELPDEFAWAQMALAFPYQPVEGDVVLAIGRSGEWYVIGLLSGNGTTTLTVPGDLALRAPSGRIELTAADGIALKSRRVSVSADRLDLLARTVVERFGQAARWVRDTFRLRAGRLRSRVEGDYSLKAGRIREIADAEVKIDGSKIHLG